MVFRFAALSVGATATMDLVLLPESSYGNGGRCLDGTMAGYYYEAPPSGESDLWVIHMAGGGACYTKDSCAKKAKTIKGTSSRWKKTMVAADIDGILSGDQDINPDFYIAHKVEVPYCTGDTHGGTVVKPTAKQWGFYFSGHLNFEFVVEHIVANIPASAKAKRILLTGNSAGGAGTILNCDFLQDKVASLGLTATVSCAPLAGWFFPGFTEDQADPELPPSTYEVWSAGGSGGFPQDQVMELYQTYLHPDCVKAHASSDLSKCGSASAVYPYIKAPMYVMENQYDTNQLTNELGLPRTAHKSPSGQEFIAYFGRAMRNSTDQIRAKAGDGLFLPSCLDHGAGLRVHPYKGELFTTRVRGYTAAQGLGDWFFGRGSVPRVIVDDCEMPGPGLPCNPTCDGVPSEAVIV